MKSYLIQENNKITNLVLGEVSLESGQTLLERTGSLADVNPGDYYLPSNQTYYAPLYPQIKITPNSELAQGIVYTGSVNVTMSYSEVISPIPTIENLTSDDLNFSNFTSTDSSIAFNAQVTSTFISSSLSEANYNLFTKGINDSNSNPISTGWGGNIPCGIDYTGSV
tara:strand:- start:342 stop:842 length:501 start_codon:yes stop_codon:yes gene_type:complete